MAPVPRELSASCGVCVYFHSDCNIDPSLHVDMDGIYLISK